MDIFLRLTCVIISIYLNNILKYQIRLYYQVILTMCELSINNRYCAHEGETWEIEFSDGWIYYSKEVQKH